MVLLRAVVAAAFVALSSAAQCSDFAFSATANANQFQDDSAPFCDGVWGTTAGGADSCAAIPDWSFDPQSPSTALSPVLDAELSGVGKNWEGVSLVNVLRVYFWNPESEPDSGQLKYQFVNATFETAGHGSKGDEQEGEYHLNSGFGQPYDTSCPTNLGAFGSAQDCVDNGGDKRACCGAVPQAPASNEYHDARCYKLRYVEVSMGSFSSGQRVDFFQEPGFNAFRGILTVYNSYPIDPVRGAELGNFTFKSEMPFVIKYKQQVVASLTPDRSVYDNINLIVQLKQQQVLIDINQVDTDSGVVSGGGVVATVKLATNVQYPFRAFSDSVVDAANCGGVGTHPIKCAGNEGRPQGARAYLRRLEGGPLSNPVTTGDWDAAVVFNDAAASLDIVSVADCADPAVGETFISGGTGAPSGSDSCTQVWTMTFKPPTGNGICELDGYYRLYVKYGCQPLFEADHDCPLIADDLDVPDTWKELNFYLDSESWCAQLAASVEATASLVAYKEPTHVQEATNFVENQVAHFVMTTASAQTTITSTTITRISIKRATDATFVDVFSRDNEAAVDTNTSPYAPPACQVDDGSSRGQAESTSSGVLNAQSDRCEVEQLYVFDGPGELEAGSAVGSAATEAHFEWKLSAGAFPVGVDAAIDFDVQVEAFVAFQDVDYDPASQVSNSLLGAANKRGLLGSTSLVAVYTITMDPSPAVDSTAAPDSETSSGPPVVAPALALLAIVWAVGVN